MTNSERRDLVREYLEARLHQPLARRSFLRLSSGVIVTTGLAGFVGACTSGAATPAPTTAPTAAPTMAPTAAPSVDISGATLEFIGLDGEDGANTEKAKAWRDERGITLNSKYIGSGDEAQAAIIAGQVFDIAITFNVYVHRWALGGLIQALDTSRLSNWNDMFEGIRSADFLNVDGKPYGAPIVWGDGPYIYSPAKVPAAERPDSIMDLFDPKWSRRVTMSNDPGLLFVGVGIAMGFTAPNFTKDQLAQIVDRCRPFVKDQVVTFAATYADATDLLVRGEADISLLGWEAMLNFAKEKGGELDFGFFREYKGGWSDSMSIPSTAVDIDAAYAYIDAMISPEINAQLAVDLVSAAVNQKAEALIPAESNLYDYDLVRTVQPGVFDDLLAPEAPTDPNVASRQEWLDAWAEITA